MQTNNQGVPPIILYAIIGVMAWMLLSKPKEPGPGPVDPVKPKVEHVVSKVLPQIKEGYKAVYSEAAAQVESKSLVGEEQLFSFLKKGLENVRVEATGDLDRMLDSNIPDQFSSDGEVAAVAGFLKQVANGW